jgi:hypothetical protein
VTSQLASVDDQDWFFLEHDASRDPATLAPLFFKCNEAADSKAVFVLATYNPLGALQSSYQVPAAQCAAANGLNFDLSLPSSGRYYLAVTTPDATTFSQADFTLRWLPNRADDEAIPNDAMSEAYPLSRETALAAKLSSVGDQDWFFFDNDATLNPAGLTSVEFSCDAQTPAGTSFELAAFNGGGQEQNRYVITSPQCSSGTGFRFDLKTPITARYYLLVKSPAGTSASRFKAAAYQVRWAPGRLLGEIEPNDRLVDAYPLTQTEAVTSQLASVDDQDWFYFYRDSSTNPSSTSTITFLCSEQLDSSAIYLVSTYNLQGVLQTNYTIGPGDCATELGFKFTINTPIMGRYYIAVSTPSEEGLSQDDFRLSLSNHNGGVNSEEPTRKEGELEPNNNKTDAYPITPKSAVTSQLSSATDEDWFVITNDSSQNPLGVTPIYFSCKQATDNSAFLVSTYNPQGLLQSSYTVTSEQCSQSSGFSFGLSTPTTDRYYLSIASPGGSDSSNFSQSDYTVSTFPYLAVDTSNPTASVSGTVKRVAIIDSQKASKDKFEIVIKNCGNSGTINISGEKLNLSAFELSPKIGINIGGWSCLSDSPDLTVIQRSQKTIYAYPKSFRPEGFSSSSSSSTSELTSETKTSSSISVSNQ